MNVKWDIESIKRDMKEKAREGVTQVAEWIRKEAVRRIEDPPKTGRWYVGFPYRVGLPPHRASAPGESPADDFGNLKRSGRVEVESSRLQASVSFGGDAVDYAADLEFGSFGTETTIEARPFLRPSVAEARKVTKQIMEAEVFK
jgi:hypothetical protein